MLLSQIFVFLTNMMIIFSDNSHIRCEKGRYLLRYLLSILGKMRKKNLWKNISEDFECSRAMKKVGSGQRRMIKDVIGKQTVRSR